MLEIAQWQILVHGLVPIYTLGHLHWIQVLADLLDFRLGVQSEWNTSIMKLHTNYREGTYLLMKTSVWATDSGLIRSYDYYDWFWQGRGDEWMNIDEAQHWLRFSQYPIPRVAVPAVTRVRQAGTYPYFQQPSREIDADLRSALNQRLQEGTHPTTQALVPLGMRYVKILGAGSQGVAVLFEMDTADGLTRQVVAKYDTGDNRDPDDLRNPANEYGLLAEKAIMRVSGSDMEHLP